MILDHIISPAQWAQTCIAYNIQDGAERCLDAFDRAASVMKPALDLIVSYKQAAGQEASLLYQGALHVGAASDDVKTALRRDITTCAVETGLTIAEEVAIEATLAVAALEAGEKMIHTSAHDRDWGSLAAGFAESVLSSASAAAHAAMDSVHDIERSGQQWQAHLAVR